MCMRRRIDHWHWLRLLRDLDERSLVHLRLFGRQVAFVLLSCSPPLLIDHHRPILFLSLTRMMFGFSALLVLVAALFNRRPVSSTSLCCWDHALAMILLALLCSVALHALA
jgi:hypothetical protein